MVLKRLVYAAITLSLLCGMAQAKHTAPKDEDPAVMQVDVAVGKNGAAFLNQLHEAARQHGFAMRVTPVDLPKKKHPKKSWHIPKQPLPPEQPAYLPMRIEIWRNDVKIVGDNTKNEEIYHFDFHNWLFTPHYVADKRLTPYRNAPGTPCEEFLHVLQTAASLIPGSAVTLVQPETQTNTPQGDSLPSPLRELQVTVSADHYRKFIKELESFALENDYAVYTDITARSVHDSFYSDPLLVIITSNPSGDIELAFYEGEDGDTSKAFNAFLKGLQSILDTIPYAIIHEQMDTACEKESC